MTGASDFVQRHYAESRFGGFTSVDGTVAFYVRVRSLLRSDHVAVDVGCGPGDGAEDPVLIRRDLRTLKGACRRVIGLDVDQGAAVNPLIDEFRPIRDGRWPLADSSVDLAVADWVVEHVERPEEFFAEAFRVMRPDGHLCLRTPNLMSYFGIASRLVPSRLHKVVRNAVQMGRPDGKPLEAWRTYYRCNTKGALRRVLRNAGFYDAWIGAHEPEPAYLSFSAFAYRVGKWHQRFAPDLFRTNLFVFARKIEPSKTSEEAQSGVAGATGSPASKDAP